MVTIDSQHAICQIDECTNPALEIYEIEIGEKNKALINVPLCDEHCKTLFED